MLGFGTTRILTPSWGIFLLTISILPAAAVAGASEHPTSEQTRAELLRVCEELRSGHSAYFGTAQVEHIRKVLAEPGLPAESQVNGRGQLGRHLVRLGQPEEAVAVFEEGIAIARREGIDPNLELALMAELGLAYLRIAETTNCVKLHGPAMCLFPIGPGGRHPDPAAAQKAAEVFRQYVARNPRNATVSFLLVVTAMSLGEYPHGLPEHLRIPESRLASAEMKPFPEIAAKVGLNIVGNAGGGLIEDFDGDGLLDVMTSSVEPCTALSFFKNDGRGGFVDAAREADLLGQLGGGNLTHADVDNDGDSDVLVLRGGWFGIEGRIRKSLLRNDGGRFVDITAAAGLAAPAYPTQTAAWGDFDNDGDLDLYVGNEGLHPKAACFPSQLFRNEGVGEDGQVRFVDVAPAAGVTNDRYTKGVAWGDYDNDGDLDLFTSNLGPSRLYRNEGPGENGQVRFVDVAPELGLSGPAQRSFATWFFDYDNDGWLDLFAADYQAMSEEISAHLLGADVPGLHPRIYHNLGPGFDGRVRFDEVSVELGVTAPSAPMGANFGDLDSDGFLDFYLGTGYPDYQALMPNLMYRNDGGQRFVDVTYTGGFGHLQKGHGVAFGDLDNDGDQDVFEEMGGAYPSDVFPSVLYENPGHGNAWVILQFSGVRSNRAGLGARVTLEIETPEGPRWIHRQVSTGGSFGGSPLRQEVGLGKATVIRRIDVFWPASGQRQTFEKVAVGRRYEVREDATKLVELPLRRIKLGAGRAPRSHQH